MTPAQSPNITTNNTIPSISPKASLTSLNNPTTWITFICIVSLTSFVFGHCFIKFLRRSCKIKVNTETSTIVQLKKSRHLTTIVFVLPIALFLGLNSAVILGYFDQMISDAISFGLVLGILVTLSQRPKGTGCVKLIVQQVHGEHTDVWLDSMDMTIGEVKSKIAEAMDIFPVNRISIETGRGSFMEDNTKQFSPLIDDTLKSTDFFGFVTLSCYIHVREEEVKRRVTINEESLNERDRADKKSNPFKGILQKQVKYGDLYLFSARIAAAVDSKSTFAITSVDRFAAAAPSSMQIISFPSVRLHSWHAFSAKHNHNSDVMSEAGESEVSSTNGKRNFFGFFQKKNSEDSKYFGKPVMNHDTVVLECGGKFMSVARGWWMAWSSQDPRRSGVFTIEIIEKAPQNKLKEQFDNIKDKIAVPGMSMISSSLRESLAQQRDADNILRPGDLFRLRSVKFPDFELGLTSRKIRDEYCYMGLRKVSLYCKKAPFTSMY